MLLPRSLSGGLLGALAILLFLPITNGSAKAQCTSIDGGVLKIKPAIGGRQGRLSWRAKEKGGNFLIADPRNGSTTLDLSIAGNPVASFTYGAASAGAWRSSGTPPRAFSYKAKNDPVAVPGIDTIRSRRTSFQVKGKGGVIDQVVAPMQLPIRLEITDSSGACYVSEFNECEKNSPKVVKCRWTPPPSSEVPNLVFQSGFEDATQHLYSTGTPAPCTDDLRGEDVSVDRLGHWENDLEGGPFGSFHFCFGGGDRTQRSLDLITDPDDPSNQVLYGKIVEPNENVNDDGIACNGDGPGARKARIQAILQDNPNLTHFDYRVRMRLGADGLDPVIASPTEITWFTLGEFWNNTPAETKTFRVTLDMVKHDVAGAPFFFGLKAEKQNDGQSGWIRVWPSGWIGTDVEVPIGEWFTLDVSVTEGNATTGRVIIRMTDADGVTHDVSDVTNWTHSPDGVPDGFKDINPLKLYTSGGLMCALNAADLPLEIWWDDFAIGTPD